MEENVSASTSSDAPNTDVIEQQQANSSIITSVVPERLVSLKTSHLKEISIIMAATTFVICL